MGLVWSVCACMFHPKALDWLIYWIIMHVIKCYSIENKQSPLCFQIWHFNVQLGVYINAFPWFARPSYNSHVHVFICFNIFNTYFVTFSFIHITHTILLLSGSGFSSYYPLPILFGFCGYPVLFLLVWWPGIGTSVL